MAGSYLYRSLKEGGYDEVDLFDVQRTTRCGCRPCAWGFTPASEYNKLLSKLIEPEKHVLQHLDSIVLDGVRIKADVLTVNKPALIADLIGGAAVRQEPIPVDDYDRVVDATGVSRAYLPPAAGPDLIAECLQYRVQSEDQLGLWFRTSKIGYEWCFPIGGNEYHIGFGNLKSKVMDYRPTIDVGSGREIRIKCKCHSRVRLSSPGNCQPFVSGGKIVGVGESIGLVGPLGADGNMYAMESAGILFEKWEDLDHYPEAILKRYDWMRKERSALEKLSVGKMPSMMDIRTFLKHSKRVGFELDTLSALRLFRKSLE